MEPSLLWTLHQRWASQLGYRLKHWSPSWFYRSLSCNSDLQLLAAWPRVTQLACFYMICFEWKTRQCDWTRALTKSLINACFPAPPAQADSWFLPSAFAISSPASSVFGAQLWFWDSPQRLASVSSWSRPAPAPTAPAKPFLFQQPFAFLHPLSLVMHVSPSQLSMSAHSWFLKQGCPIPAACWFAWWRASHLIRSDFSSHSPLHEEEAAESLCSLIF